MEPIAVVLASQAITSLVAVRRVILVGGLALLLGAIALAVYFGSRSTAPAEGAVPEVVIRLEPSQVDEPTLVQPIMVGSQTGGGGVWVSVMSAAGGLLSGVGAFAAVWVKARGATPPLPPSE